VKFGPIVFLAALSTLAASWCGFVLAPQLQLGRELQATNLVNLAEMYPLARPGLAQQGAEVYRANGCAACHTRQVSQTGVRIDVVLSEAGTNAAALADALVSIGADPADAAGPLPKVVLPDVAPNVAKAAAAALRKAKATAQIRVQPTGVDITRGWGQRQSVARDYLFDARPLLGLQRVGPDLANVGQRLPDATWHLRHLYAPQTVVSNSIMPRYTFLFEARHRSAGQPVAPDAIRVAADGSLVDPGQAPSAGERELVPTPEGRALVAYLLSLKTDGVLYETPMTVARRASASTNAPAP